MEFPSSDIFFLSPDNKVILFALFLAGFFPYIRDVLRESTHPHPISWFMWSLPFVLYRYDLFSFSSACAASTVFIFILSLRRGASDISRSDWIYLVAGLAALAWLVFPEGSYNEEAETELSDLFRVFAGVFAIAVFIFAPFGPTFRKSISRPFEETLSPYIAAVVFWTLSIYSRSDDTTVVFVSAIPLLPNLAFVALVLGRRRALGPQVIDRADRSPSLV